ncbi:MAG: hypothetical protein AAGF81_14885 [Pseudomonadota bacterium]
MFDAKMPISRYRWPKGLVVFWIGSCLRYFAGLAMIALPLSMLIDGWTAARSMVLFLMMVQLCAAIYSAIAINRDDYASAALGYALAVLFSAAALIYAAMVFNPAAGLSQILSLLACGLVFCGPALAAGVILLGEARRRSQLQAQPQS